MGSIIPFGTPLRPSRRLLAAQAIMHGLALAAVFAVPLAWKLRMLLALPLLASLWQRSREYRHAEYTHLAIKTDGLWLQTAQGPWIAAGISGDSFTHPWLTVLRFRVAEHSRARALVLLPDSLSVDAHRRLRVWLRWSRQHDGETVAML